VPYPRNGGRRRRIGDLAVVGANCRTRVAAPPSAGLEARRGARWHVACDRENAACWSLPGTMASGWCPLDPHPENPACCRMCALEPRSRPRGRLCGCTPTPPSAKVNPHQAGNRSWDLLMGWGPGGAAYSESPSTFWSVRGAVGAPRPLPRPPRPPDPPLPLLEAPLGAPPPLPRWRA
jgi:hypothetical protein